MRLVEKGKTDVVAMGWDEAQAALAAGTHDIAQDAGDGAAVSGEKGPGGPQEGGQGGTGGADGGQRPNGGAGELPADLDDKTRAGLDALAAERGVDVSKATTKAEVIKTLRGALMDAFAMATNAIFEDPHLAVDAMWRAGGGATGVPVRVIRKSPDAVIGLGDNRYDLDAMLIDVRLSEIPEPAEGDQVDILDDAGDIIGTVEVIGLAGIDRRRAVRTLEVSAVQPDDPDP